MLSFRLIRVGIFTVPNCFVSTLETAYGSKGLSLCAAVKTVIHSDMKVIHNSSLSLIAKK